MPSEQLLIEGRQWLRRVVDLQSQSLTLAQHREVLTLSGWLALWSAAWSTTRATVTPPSRRAGPHSL